VPFPGGTARDKANKHLNDTPWHPRRFNPDLHEEFVEVIADMMEKDPKTRIQSAAEVVSRLEQFADVAAPLGERMTVKSPWSSAPLPSAPDDERTEPGQDSEGSQLSIGLSGSADASASQASQGTLSAAAQETSPLKPLRPRPGSLPGEAGTEPLSIPMVVALTLAISIPLAMVAGALIATVALRMFGG
jgi:eukaryotic-like serine/threonine-protein kinase